MIRCSLCGEKLHQAYQQYELPPVACFRRKKVACYYCATEIDEMKVDYAREYCVKYNDGVGSDWYARFEKAFKKTLKKIYRKCEKRLKHDQ